MPKKDPLKQEDLRVAKPEPFLSYFGSHPKPDEIRGLKPGSLEELRVRGFSPKVHEPPYQGR